jgi:hypothetical protein
MEPLVGTVQRGRGCFDYRLEEVEEFLRAAANWCSSWVIRASAYAN